MTMQMRKSRSQRSCRSSSHLRTSKTESRRETGNELRKYSVGKKDGIATITFNRPKVLNALNRKTVEELQSALLDVREDFSVRVDHFDRCGRKIIRRGSRHRRTFPADARRRKRIFTFWPERFSFAGNAWASHRFVQSTASRLAAAANSLSVVRFASPAKMRSSVSLK